MIHSRGHAAPKPCNLSHHHPGRHVTWNAFDKNLGESVEMRGIVEGHRPDIRYAIVRTTGGQTVRMSCGPLNPVTA